MANRAHTKIAIVAACAVAQFAGCFSGARNAQENPEVPPGLDQESVQQAQEIAEESFVPAAQENEAASLAAAGKENLARADEFWQYLEQQVQRAAVSSADQAQFDRELKLGAQALTRWKKLTNNGEESKALASALVHCQKAKEHLERAVRLNPFDKNARALLAVVYYNLQNHFGQANNYEKSIEILERLVRIERGEHELFRLLGENYLAVGQYEQALQNFMQGQTVFAGTNFEGQPDPGTLFYYEYMLGDTYARLHEAEQAVTHFQKARTYAKSPQEIADIDNYLSWIDWDAGNLRASEIWDQVVALEAKKEYGKMASLCEKLLPQLTTPEAKLAVHQKLAVVEFEFLGKKGRAAERMLQVFKTLPPEQLASPSERAKPILDTFGAMLYRLGVDARERDLRKRALAYFTKATTFAWDQRARAYMELVTLVWNSPEKAIAYGEKALKYGIGVLDDKETCDLLSLMVKAHKSAGRFEKARIYYTNWKKCQEKT